MVSVASVGIFAFMRQLICFYIAHALQATTLCGDMRPYDVIWTDLLPDSNDIWTNTMPVGNGNTAANVWADNSSGTISMLLSKQDAWNEMAEPIKVGFVNVSFNPNPFSHPNISFRQHLQLDRATVFFSIGDLNVSVHVDALSNVLVLKANWSGKTFDVNIMSIPIRTDRISMTPMFDCNTYESYPDVVAPPQHNAVFVYHRNADLGQNTYFRQTLKGENIDTLEMLRVVKDPLTNLTSGTVTFASGGLNVFGNTLIGRNLQNLSMGIAAITLQDDGSDVSSWMREALRLTRLGVPEIDAHTAWWSSFWRRSCIALGSAKQRQTTCNDPDVQPPQKPWSCEFFGCTCQGMADYYGVMHGVTWGCAPQKAQYWWTYLKKCSADAQTSDNAGCDGGSYCEDEFLVSRQYAVQRYLQAIQARSPFPIKFNGMLFTAQKPPKIDYRQWGGHNWWQNVRLPYYNMLAAGDADLLETMLQFFTNTLPLAKERTEVYYPNFTDRGAAFWPEYTSMFGTTHPSSYGCGRAGKTDPPIWWSSDVWNHYNVQGALDAVLFLLDHFSHTQDQIILLKHLPFARAVVEYFRQRWKGNGFDSNGKVIIYPTQVVETWQCPGYPPQPETCVTNDAPTVAGLHAVMSRLLALPNTAIAGAISHDVLEKWREFADRLPPLPLQSEDGRLAPCEKCPNVTSNVENGELYSIHPYRIFTKASGRNLTPAIDAFRHKRFPGDVGWNQVAMDAALLGLGSEAQRYVRDRARTPPAIGYRFPGFMPHEQDYPPSSDHLAVFSNALTYMLLQTKDDTEQGILLLPAWPCSWDVTFTLHGPLRTSITGTLTNGSLSYSVDPPSRASAVEAALCLADISVERNHVEAKPNCKLGVCESTKSSSVHTSESFLV